MAELWIDTREGALQAALFAIGVPFKKQQLDVSDIAWVGPDGRPWALLERKTVADLAASIVDGRFREQKLRLQATGCWFGYLIEGSLWDWAGSPTADQCAKALLGVSWFQSTAILMTTSVQESALLLKSFGEKLQDPKWAPVIEQAPTDPDASGAIDEPSTKKRKIQSHYLAALSAVSTERKKNVNAENALSMMLAQLPKISMAAAEAIRGVFPTMVELTTAVATMGRQEAIAHLAGLKVKARRLGPVAAQTVVHFLLGIPQSA